MYRGMVKQEINNQHKLSFYLILICMHAAPDLRLRKGSTFQRLYIMSTLIQLITLWYLDGGKYKVPSVIVYS